MWWVEISTVYQNYKQIIFRKLYKINEVASIIHIFRFAFVLWLNGNQGLWPVLAHVFGLSQEELAMSLIFCRVGLSFYNPKLKHPH